MSHQKFKNCIEACYACAVECEHCASENLNESDVKMLINCINLTRECAAFCKSAAQVMSMGGRFSQELCALCAEICETCAEECGKHTHLEHCKKCAQECRKCAGECRAMVKEDNVFNYK